MNASKIKILGLCLGSLLIAGTANAFHGDDSGVSFGVSIGDTDRGYWDHGRYYYYDDGEHWYRHARWHHHRHHGDFDRDHRDFDRDHRERHEGDHEHHR